MCCQIDEDVFLICLCFIYLNVFSEVAARLLLLATVDAPCLLTSPPVLLN